MSGGATSAAGEERWVPALLAVAHELWVLRDRQRALEELLAAKGVVASGEADDWQPDERRQAEIDAECQAFVARIVAQMMPREDGGAGPRGTR